MNNVLILIKPDAIERGLVGEIIKRFENKGFKILNIRECIPLRDKLKRHYAEHKDKPFYDNLINTMQATDVIIAILFYRKDAIDVARNIVLKKIREDYALENPYNCVHASDSEDSYKREAEIWFGE